jgi:acylphosphatase
MTRKVLCLAVLLGAVPAAVRGQPDGWKMTDRFAGFRYEVFGTGVQEESFHKGAQDKAEAIGCFGWVQNTGQGTAVGEARCSKRAAPAMKKWLEAGTDAAKVERVAFKDYADTKIRYHFSHFRILEDGRETCFREAPHQCAPASGGGKKHDEL